MKLDIKSFLIGILTTVNLFLLMSFDDHEEENQNGRYQVIIDSKGDQYWYDTRYGDKIAIGSKSYGYILLKEEGGMKERFEKDNWVKYTKHDYTDFNVVHTWFEYINRLLGVLAGFSVLLMFIFSLFLQNNKKVFIPLSSIILISIGLQAWLGKLVVDSNLAPYKISTHLLMAIIIVLLMVYNIKKTDEIKT